MPLAVQLALMMAGVTLALATDLPMLRCPTNTTTLQCTHYRSDEFIVNDNNAFHITYVVNESITLDCLHDHFRGDLSDAAHTPRWLPQFTPTLHVENVHVKGCRPTHYATVLAALNVTLTSPFNLDMYRINGEPLDDTHFTDLPPLRHLVLSYPGVSRSLLPSLEGLTMLDLDSTSLPDDVLEALPRTLTELRLKDVNITRVPAAVLDLPELRLLHLKIWTPTTMERGNASRLQQLYVNRADAALMSDWAPPALEEVTLMFWQAERPNPLPDCDKLVKLTLVFPHVSELPAGWVARCPRLKELHINGAYVLELPARLLENATQLTSFGIRHTHLSSLPAQLFADSPHLTHLDLSFNQFKELPSAMLTLPLLSLDLGYNELNTSVVAEVVATFTELRNLSLAANPEVRDLCAVNHSNVTEHKLKSSLVSLSKLERLELQGTNVSVICSDWREDMVNLKNLDLSYTKIRNVTYETLRYKRSVPAVVKLSGTVHFSADDYDRAAAAAAVAPPTRKVTVMLSSYFCYDCSLYWLMNALNGDLLPLDDVVIGSRLFHSLMIPTLKTVRAEDLFCDKKRTCANQL